MNFKQSLIVAVSCLVLAVTASDNGLWQHDSDRGLLSFMSRSNELLQSNPTRSLECFNYYVPLINALALKYEADYKDCMNASANGRARAEEATLDQRNDLANRAEDACELVKQCSKSESSVYVFNCYTYGGSKNAKAMYGIKTDASEGLAEFWEELRLIENQEERCTNQTKRVYEMSSAEAYDSLNNCILGISEVPTEAPSTATTSTEANSTEASSTEASSTDASSTEYPSTDGSTSTNAPSTDASSTETSSTDAPSSVEGSTKESEEEKLPEEDLSRFIALKNLKYRLKKYKV